MEKKRILLVDDEPGFTHLIKMIMPQYEVREENNPACAIEAAREFKPHLILLDVVMPEVDGGEIAAQLKAEPLLKRVPVVFLTAIVSEKRGQNEQTIGGYPFIAKPVSRDALLACIEEHLEPKV